MSFNYDKLRGKIREIFKTEAKFAEAMEISTTSLSAKLNNKVEWKPTEMDKACVLLHINKQEIPTYFFTPEVQELEPNQ
jgi:hypothetical protein